MVANVKIEKEISSLLYRSFNPDTYLSYELIMETLPAQRKRK